MPDAVLYEEEALYAWFQLYRTGKPAYVAPHGVRRRGRPGMTLSGHKACPSDQDLIERTSHA